MNNRQGNPDFDRHNYDRDSNRGGSQRDESSFSGRGDRTPEGGGRRQDFGGQSFDSARDQQSGRSDRGERSELEMRDGYDSGRRDFGSSEDQGVNHGFGRSHSHDQNRGGSSFGGYGGQSYGNQGSGNQGSYDHRNRGEGNQSWGGNPQYGQSAQYDRSRQFGNQAGNQGYGGESYQSFGQGNQSYGVGQGSGQSAGGGRTAQMQGQSHFGKGPKGFKRSDESIKERVSEALSDHHEIDASDIEVKVANGEVTLSGTVSDRQTKRMAEHILDSVAGVDEVRNELRVKRETETASSQGNGGTTTKQNDGTKRANPS